MDELMDKNLRYFVGGNLTTLFATSINVKAATKTAVLTSCPSLVWLQYLNIHCNEYLNIAAVNVKITQTYIYDCVFVVL